MVANIVLAIIFCIFNLAQIGIYTVLILVHTSKARHCDNPLHSSLICRQENRSSIYLFYVLIFLMVADTILAIISAVFSCKIGGCNCCCSKVCWLMYELREYKRMRMMHWSQKSRLNRAFCCFWIQILKPIASVCLWSPNMASKEI